MYRPKSDKLIEIKMVFFLPSDITNTYMTKCRLNNEYQRCPFCIKTKSAKDFIAYALKSFGYASNSVSSSNQSDR